MRERNRGGNEKVFLSLSLSIVSRCGFCLHFFIVLQQIRNVQVTETLVPTIPMNSSVILEFSHIEMLELITFLIVRWKFSCLMISHAHTRTHAKLWRSTFMISTKIHSFLFHRIGICKLHYKHLMFIKPKNLTPQTGKQKIAPKLNTKIVYIRCICGENF